MKTLGGFPQKLASSRPPVAFNLQRQVRHFTCELQRNRHINYVLLVMGDVSEIKPRDDLGVQPWVTARLAEMKFEGADMLVNYVLLLIANEKSMPEITNELNELLGEEESATFCKDLGEEMTRRKRLSVRSGAISGQKRLLESAMMPVAQGVASDKNVTKVKERAGFCTDKRRDNAVSETRVSITERLGQIRSSAEPKTVDPALLLNSSSNKRLRGSDFIPGSTPHSIPVAQQMALLAQAQGFASVDAMMLAQQQAMQAMLMVGTMGRGRGGRGWSGRGGALDFGADRGRGRGADGGRGRGRGGHFDGVPSFGKFDSGSGRGQSELVGSRGRGRRTLDSDDNLAFTRIEMNSELPSGR